MDPRTIPSPDRHYGLDWLRIGAFAILIFYHIGMYFAPGTWLVKAPETIDWVAWPMVTVQPWRMPLLFVVSGFASYALLQKSPGPGAFARARSFRLLLPLLFGMAVIVPPQTWTGLAENHGYSQSFLHFWATDSFSFREIAGVPLPSEEHLWFIAYLWTYTMVLAAALRLAPATWTRAADRVVAWLSQGSRLVWAPLLPLLLLRVAILFTIPERHGLLHDWVSDLLYVPPFLFGFALAAHPPLWQAVLRAGRMSLRLALAALLVLLAIEGMYGDALSRALAVLHREAQLVMAWTMILVLLGLAHRFFNRDHPLRARLSEAVFPFYLLHQTVIVLVGWSLRNAGLPAAAMFLVLTAATLAARWLFYEAGRRSGPFAALIGLRPGRRLSRPAPRAAAAGA